MQENIQQQLYPEDPLTQALRERPEIAAAVRGLDMRSVSMLGSLYQMDMHSTLLATSLTDKDGLENVMGLCQGGNAFVSWLLSARERLDELDRERVDELESRAEAAEDE